jgi:hypothetical protein
MADLKFRDIDSLNAVTGALHKNGYNYSTFVVWKKDGGGIDYFTVQIPEGANIVDIAPVVRCKNCDHKYLNKHGEPCCKIWTHDRDTVVRDYDFCSYGKRKTNV